MSFLSYIVWLSKDRAQPGALRQCSVMTNGGVTDRDRVWVKQLKVTLLSLSFNVFLYNFLVGLSGYINADDIS